MKKKLDNEVFSCYRHGYRKGMNTVTLGERIKKVRKGLDLTQQEFAGRIGTTANVLTNYETGRRNPSNSVINNVCKTFNVNEAWLRYGSGEMFLELSRDEEIAAFVGGVLADESADFKRRFIAALSKLSPEGWDALEQFVGDIARRLPADPEPPAAAPALTVEQEVDQEVERYRQQLLLEKRQALQASTVKKSGTA